MTILCPPAMTVNVPPPPTVWRQQIMLSGKSLALIERVGDFVRSNPQVNSIILRGRGPFIPHLVGPDWAVACCELHDADDATLSDLTGLVDALLSVTLAIETDADDRSLFACFREIGL